MLETLANRQSSAHGASCTSPLIARQGTLLASELTASRARDATRVLALLTQIQAPLVSVAADSAYDKEAVYEAIEAHSPGRRTRVVIPPQRNATLSQNSNTAMQERDRHIRAIERHGRREWYKLSGYTKPKHGGERGLSLQGDHRAGDAGSNVGEATS